MAQAEKDESATRCTVAGGLRCPKMASSSSDRIIDHDEQRIFSATIDIGWASTNSSFQASAPAKTNDMDHDQSPWWQKDTLLVVDVWLFPTQNYKPSSHRSIFQHSSFMRSWKQGFERCFHYDPNMHRKVANFSLRAQRTRRARTGRGLTLCKRRVLGMKTSK